MLRIITLIVLLIRNTYLHNRNVENADITVKAKFQCSVHSTEDQLEK